LVADAAQRAEGEQALVFEPYRSARRRVDVFAADRARGTRLPGHAARSIERFARKLLRFGEGALLEVTRRQRGQAVERQQIGDGAQLAILGGGGAERALR